MEMIWEEDWVRLTGYWLCSGGDCSPVWVGAVGAGGGGQPGAPQLRRGGNSGGRVHEVLRRGVRGACRVETSRISSLERKKHINIKLSQSKHPSRVQLCHFVKKKKTQTTSSWHPRSTQSCLFRSKPLEHLQKDRWIAVWSVMVSIWDQLHHRLHRLHRTQQR